MTTSETCRNYVRRITRVFASVYKRGFSVFSHMQACDCSFFLPLFYYLFKCGLHCLAMFNLFHCKIFACLTKEFFHV